MKYHQMLKSSYNIVFTIVRIVIVLLTTVTTTSLNYLSDPRTQRSTMRVRDNNLENDEVMIKPISTPKFTKEQELKTEINKQLKLLDLNLKSKLMIIKRIVILLIFIIIILFILIGVYTGFSLLGDKDFIAKLNSELTILPYTAALIDERNLDYGSILIHGNYSTHYHAPSTHIIWSGKTPVFENLHNIGVHLYSGNSLGPDLLQGNAASIKQKPVGIELLESNLLGFYSMVVYGPVDIDSSFHVGEMEVSKDAYDSISFNGTKINVMDFSRNEDMSIVAEILPERSEYITIAPLNDFRILFPETGQNTTPQIYFGQFMREDQYYVISALPWSDSRINADTGEALFSDFKIPCTISIESDSLDSVTLNKFHGWYRIQDTYTKEDPFDKNYEIIQFNPSNLIIEINPVDASHISVVVTLKGTLKDLVIDGERVHGFSQEYKRNLATIFEKNLFLIILGILSSICAKLIQDWIENKSAQP